ncbi:MAG TPA: four helix bundle protein [Lentimicrobium sp.]|jgi:four helix bundle protein|nr:four helix bundle protein [Lentimicrobium sp.]
MALDLPERLLKFSISSILFIRTLPNTDDLLIIKKQLIKSSTSAGANYEEAQAASSKADFTNKARIALKEMRETNYWLKVINGILFSDEQRNNCKQLISESTELKNILGAICKKTERKKDIS